MLRLLIHSEVSSVYMVLNVFYFLFFTGTE